MKNIIIIGGSKGIGNALLTVLLPNHKVINISRTAPEKQHSNLTHFSCDILNDELPEISRYDPVAQAIGMRPGQICKIIRPSKTAITTDYYRLCSQ